MFPRRTKADFASMFSQKEPIEYEGKQIWSAYWAKTVKGEQWTIEFERFAARPIQGLMVAGRGRGLRLSIASQVADQFVLWTDTAPRMVEIAVTSAPDGTQIGFYNVWRDSKHGTMMYGINAAAIEIVGVSPEETVLRCSDGWKGPDFNDLVVRLRRSRVPQAL